MNRKRAFALGAAAVFAVFAWSAPRCSRAPDIPAGLRASPGAAGDRDRERYGDAAASSTKSPASPTTADDPDDRARHWLLRAEAAAHARRARLFGDNVARLLALPADQAWAALVARARDGDRAAATAALHLAVECRQWLATEGTQGSSRLPDSTTLLPLAEDHAGYVREAARNVHERQAARLQSCDEVGGVMDLALLAIDRMFGPDAPDIRLAEAADIEDDATAIAALRALAADDDAPAIRVELGQRLMKSRDAQAQAEGRALLEHLASGDADVVDVLAACFAQGCGAFPPDPTVADAWVERAAGLGSWRALGSRIAALEAQGDAASAWAWSLYRLDLAQLGCFGLFQPEWTHLAEATQGAYSIGSMLQPSQEARGREFATSLSRHWMPLALERLACG